MKQFIKESKEQYGHYSYFCGFDNIHEGVKAHKPLPYSLWLVTFIYYHLKDMLVRQICERRGHNLIDESYGNAETGCVDVSCTRCGYHYHQTLY